VVPSILADRFSRCEVRVVGLMIWSGYPQATESALVEARFTRGYLGCGLLEATVRPRTSEWRKSYSQCMKIEPVM
jgi:hypothetical protein